MNGIFCGRDSTVAVEDAFCIAFLRLNDGRIISLLKHTKDGVVGIVSGKGVAAQYSNTTVDDSCYCIKEIPGGTIRFNDETMSAEMEAHNKDRIAIDDDGNMTYTMYDGTVFLLKLAEKTGGDYFDKKEYAEPLPVSRKMALWNICKYYNTNAQHIWAGIDTERYSIYFEVDDARKVIYCRVGQNGYCEKGWAMRSTTCIRLRECRMIKDNLDAIKNYVPDERCFVAGSCAFPADGGWYWSLKSVEDDVIYLNGCGGDTYTIRQWKARRISIR